MSATSALCYLNGVAMACKHHMGDHMAEPTATSSMASAAASAAATAMSHMDMDMGDHHHGAPSCKINMLWNWNTIDACFLAESWHITSRSMFGGTCVGVICLVILLEAVRRLHREFDRMLIRKWRESNVQKPGNVTNTNSAGESGENTDTTTAFIKQNAITSFFVPAQAADRYVPSIWVQMVRAVIYMFEMAGAYFIMLLAMYYNGYILICIFLGALIGFLIFGSDTVACESQSNAPTTGGAMDKGMCCC